MILEFSTDLEPCPFCGSKLTAYGKPPKHMCTEKYKNLVFAGCVSCGAYVGNWDANRLGIKQCKEFAKEAWNRRA